MKTLGISYLSKSVKARRKTSADSLCGWMSGKQLCALGMNFNLAPVLDVNSNAANPVIGIRSYGRNPQDAWFYASQAMRGYLDAGVM